MRVLLVVATVILGCTPDGPTARGIAHPIADSLSVPLQSPITLRKESVPDTPAAVLHTMRRLQSGRVLASIGEFQGSSERVFGSVATAAFLDSRLLAIVDVQAGAVPVYSLDGEYAYTIGRHGQGPGEFDAPLKAVSVDSLIWVVDGARKLHLFRWFSDSARHVRQTITEGFPRDACRLEDGLILHMPGRMPGMPHENIFSRMSDAGVHHSSFVPPYRYAQRLVGDRISRAKVACLQSGALLAAFEHVNQLHRYDTDSGDVEWQVVFAEVAIPPLMEVVLPNGNVGVQTRVGELPYFHHLLGIVSDGDNAVIVQFARSRFTGAAGRDAIERLAIESYIVDTSTGVGLYAGESLPQLLVISGNHAAALTDAAFPQVAVLELEEVGHR